MRWLRRLFSFHEWEYRNPYDRRCAVCGRVENYYTWNIGDRYGWWEAHNDGDASKH